MLRIYNAFFQGARKLTTPSPYSWTYDGSLTVEDTNCEWHSYQPGPVAEWGKGKLLVSSGEGCFMLQQTDGLMQDCSNSSA